MKAELKSNGTLVVTAETELEQYALRQWSFQNVKVSDDGPGTISIDHFIVDTKDEHCDIEPEGGWERE